MKEINIPYLKYFTHAYIYGSLKNDKIVIVIHGGPGGNSSLYMPITDLTKYGYTVVLYDQLGCGLSSNIKGHVELYKMSTYLNELDNLIKKLKIKQYCLFGHSWGGMVALNYMKDYKTSGLKKLILFSSLSSSKVWNESNLRRCLSHLNKTDQDYYKQCYQEKNFGHHRASKIYNDKLRKYYRNRKNTSPYPYKKKAYNDSVIIYRYMWGKNDLFGFGTLENWDVTPSLKNIKVPTLILSGSKDQSTPEVNALMHKNIKGSKYVYLSKSAHCGYFNEYQKSLKAIVDFLA